MKEEDLEIGEYYFIKVPNLNKDIFAKYLGEKYKYELTNKWFLWFDKNPPKEAWISFKKENKILKKATKKEIKEIAIDLL